MKIFFFGESLPQTLFRASLLFLTIYLYYCDHFMGSASIFVMLVFLMICSLWKNEKIAFLNKLQGESLRQAAFRISLLFLAIHLYYCDHFMGSASGFVMLVFLMICSLWKNEKIIILNEMQKLFFSNETQKEFMDIFCILLWLAIIFPFNYCNSIRSLVIWCQNNFFDAHFTIPYFNIDFHAHFVNVNAFHFILWDIIVIFMSIVLSYLYKDAIFSTIDEKHNIKNFSIDIKKLNKKITYSVFFMVLSLCFFLFTLYEIALFLLIFSAYWFITTDIWLIDFFEKSGTNQGDKFAIRIKRIKESLYFANIPAIAGLSILFFTAIIFFIKGHSQGDDFTTTAFIAGGSAMHLVFGNLIVGISLREENKEGVRK